MKEQVIASRGSRASRGSAAQPRGFVQRPVRRDGTSARVSSFSPRALFAYVPKALKFILGLLILIFLFVGYRAAASASLFQVRSIDVTGTSRVSAEEVEGLTRRAVARTGVWRADLSAISAELGRLPGVRRAVVSRVLPDRLRVRVIERTPAAVVHTAAGHFFWVDEEGVALGEMKPADSLPSFFIRGWNEDGTEEARSDNAERLQKYLELTREWSTLGLSDRVSEVNLIDLHDVRAQLSGNDSQIEIRLGAQELGARLKLALETLDQYKQTPRGSSITYIDIQTGRIVIGAGPGSRVSPGAEAPAVDATSDAPAPTPSPKQAGTANAKKQTSENASINKTPQKPIRSNAANNSRIRLR